MAVMKPKNLVKKMEREQAKLEAVSWIKTVLRRELDTLHSSLSSDGMSDDEIQMVREEAEKIYKRIEQGSIGAPPKSEG